jgi:hypothetical protein
VAKVREVIGTLDGKNTHLCSFLRERVTTRPYDPNDSHLWHNHVSVTTEYVNDPQTYKDLLDIMFGDLTQEDDDMPLDANDKKWIQGELAKLPAGVWNHKLDPGPFAERIGGYPAGATYAAGGLQVGADAYGREFHQALPDIMEAILKLGQPDLSDAERAELAQAIVDRIKIRLVDLEGNPQ